MGAADRRGPKRRPPRQRRADPARLAALETLLAVEERDAYANLVLPSVLRRHGLTGRDAALATELAFGTLRGLGTYDLVLSECLDRPLDRLDAGVRAALRLGVHQLLATRVPPHAAVATSVDLVAAHQGEGPVGLVNAVLRRVSARDFADWVAHVAPSYDSDPVGHLAVQHAHPRWIAQAILDSLGGDLGELAACLAADNEPPVVTLAARPGQSDVAELLAAGAEPGRWSPYAARLPAGDPGAISAVKEHRAGVQDEGSQLTAIALTRVPVEGVEHRWLDCCAGPGGKAALLAGIAAERGVALLAGDRQPHRAQLVAAALRGTPGNHAVVVADATTPPWPLDTFDRVLVDAPCSGLGALRRRPESRWRRQPSDVAALRPLQRALLEAALRSVRPGGVVAYITCSPHLAETRTIVADVLRGRSDVVRLDAREFLPEMSDLGSGPDAQMWPHRHGVDAMYLALLRRIQ